MNYPIWDIPTLGAPLLIAIVAILHVYVAHFAIGGGLFLTLTESLGHRRKDKGILDFVEKNSKLFLLVTMVFGALSGVGIWFTISTIHPPGTSTLIHSFVFGWATEWVFFVVEIAALFVYAYTFKKLSAKQHMRVGLIYFVFAWLSLFVINGIVAFMLTPGDWIDDGSFWSGFFNPTMWPSLVFRTLLCVMLAGLFGFFASSRLEDDKLSLTLARHSAKWMLIPLLLMAPAGYWYLNAIPEAPRALIRGGSPEMPMLLHFAALSVPLLLFGGLLMAARLPKTARKAVAIILLISGLMYMGSFEWIREAARRPWIIPGHMYSNGLTPDDIERASKEGFLANAPWAKTQDPNSEDAGAELFKFQCQACHTVNGARNDIVPLVSGRSHKFLKWKLANLDQGGYMPPFAGTHDEAKQLALYLLDDGAFYYLDDDAKALVKKMTDKDRVAGIVSIEAKVDVQDQVPEWPPQKVDSKHTLFAWWDGSEPAYRLVQRGESPELLEIQGAPSAKPMEGFPGYHWVEVAMGEAGEKVSTILSPSRDNFGCFPCHGSVYDIADIHKRIEKTGPSGLTVPIPESCVSCHDDISASVHRFHWKMAANEPKSSCESCHVGDNGSGFLRGHHLEAGLNCVSCHGDMKRLASTKDKNKRFPDCLQCHDGFDSPSTDSLDPKEIESKEPFNTREDEAGVPCAACHGDAHTLFPASGGKGIINPSPLQGADGPIGAEGNCQVCHTSPVSNPVHHPGIPAARMPAKSDDVPVDGGP